jgi:hypothetical protein
MHVSIYNKYFIKHIVSHHFDVKKMDLLEYIFNFFAFISLVGTLIIFFYYLRFQIKCKNWLNDNL